MGSLKFYRDEPLFGFDIGHASLKAMQVENMPGKPPRVLGYGISNFEPSAIENGVITKPELVAGAAHELFEKKLVGAITTQRVACSLPTSRTFSRPMTVPVIDQHEILDAIRLEAEQYIPIPINNLYLDYEVLRQDQQHIELLLVAASKNIVDSYLRVLELLDLQPIAFEPTMNATSRLVQLQGVLNSQPAIIVDIGSVTADIAVFDKNLLVASTVNSGSDNITDLIAGHLHLSHSQANDLKNDSGIAFSEHQQRIIDAIRPILENLVREIQKSVRYYSERAAKSGGKLSQVITVGGGATMPGLSHFLTQELRLPVHNLEPWQNIDFGRLPQPAETDRSVYITAVGEALLNPAEVLV